MSGRAGGASHPPYDAFNLADHVGDEPAHVAANRARLVAATGRPAGDVVWMNPIHGRTVVRVEGGRPQRVPDCDGLVTTTPGLVLVALAADCVPVLLSDSDAGVVVAVHAGRRGVRLGVATVGVAAMVDAGAQADRIEALLGPAVCGSHYEVPADMQRDVERYAPGSAVRTADGRPGLDLRAGLDGQLRSAGVTRIVHDPRCTFEDPALFSHRRDGTTGRQAGLIWLDPVPTPVPAPDPDHSARPR